jgi:hypothetical protein
MMVGGKHLRNSPKHKSVSLLDLLSTAHCFVGVSFTRSLKSNVCRTVTIPNNTESNLLFQKAIAIQLDVFLTGRHRLLVIKSR